MASPNLRALALDRASRRSRSTASWARAGSSARANARGCSAWAGGASALAGAAAAAASASGAIDWRRSARMELEEDGAVLEVEEERRVVAGRGGVDVRGAGVRHPFDAGAQREWASELITDGGPPDVAVLPGKGGAGAGRVAIEHPLEVEGEPVDRPEVQAGDDRPVEPGIEVAVGDVLHPGAPGIRLVREAAADEELVAECDAGGGGAIGLSGAQADGACRGSRDGAAQNERRGWIGIAQQRGCDPGGEPAAEPRFHLAGHLVVQDARRAVVEEVRREELVLEAHAHPLVEPVRDLDRAARHLVIGVRVGRWPVHARVVVAAEGEVGLHVRASRVEPVGVRVSLDRVVEDVVGPAPAGVQLQPVEAAVDQLAFERVLRGAGLAPAHAGVQPHAARQVQGRQIFLRLAIARVELRRPPERSLRVREPAQRLLGPAEVLPAVGRLAGEAHLGPVRLQRCLVVALLAQSVRAGADLIDHQDVQRRGGLARLLRRGRGRSQGASQQCGIQAHRPFLQASSRASSTSLADNTFAPSLAFTSSTAGLPSAESRMSMSMGPSSPRDRAARTPRPATSGRSTRSTPSAFPTRPSLRPVLRSTTAAGTLPSLSTKRFKSYSSPDRNSCQTTSSGLAHARSSAPWWTTTPRPPRPKRGFERSGKPSASASSSWGVAEEKVAGTATPARSRSSAVRSLSFATSTPDGSEMQKAMLRSRSAVRMRATTGNSAVTVETTSVAFSRTAIARSTATKRGSRAAGTNRKSVAGDATSRTSVPTTR